jgi:cytochrome c-type biogenesis protein CcmH/NrfF
LDAFIASLFVSLWLLDLQQSNDAVRPAAFAAPLHCPTCSEMNDPLSIASLRRHLSLPQLEAFIASLFVSLWLLDLQQSNDAVRPAAFAAPLHCPTCSEMMTLCQ